MATRKYILTVFSNGEISEVTTPVCQLCALVLFVPDHILDLLPAQVGSGLLNNGQVTRD